MDIEKVRQLSDTELEDALARSQAGPVGRALRALDPPTQGLQHDPADAANDRADPDRPARAQARPDGADGRSRDDRSRHPGARQAEDQGRPRRERQDGQDDRRVRRAPGAPPAVQAGHPLDARSSRPTTRPTRPASATPSSSRSRGRCRRPSAGAWSRSSQRAGEHGLPGEVVAEEAETTEAIHAAAHPGRDAATADDRRPTRPTADGGGRRVIQSQTRLKVADNTGARTIQCIRVMGRSLKTDGRRRRRHHRQRQAGHPERRRQEGRRRPRGHRPHGQGIRPAGRQLHPLRRERRRADQQPGQPARDAHLRPGRPRAARPQLHEDRLARPGGAVMAVRDRHAAQPQGARDPQGRHGRRARRQGRRQARHGRAGHPPRRPAPSAARSVFRRGSPAGGVSVVVEGLNIAKRHTKPRQSAEPDDRDAQDPAGRHPRDRPAAAGQPGDARLLELRQADPDRATRPSTTAVASASAATAASSWRSKS